MSEMLELFNRGGLVMYALLLASIATVSISVERFIYYQTADTGRSFSIKASELLKNKDYVGLKNLCEISKGDNAKILLNAIELKKAGPIYLEKHLETEAGLCVADLRQRIPYLGVVVTMAPLLGLLGTVVGMISSFNVFAAQTGQPAAITGGVGEALVATAAGLCVALVALVAHSYFAQRIDNILTDMERTFSAFIESLYRGDSDETA